MASGLAARAIRKIATTGSALVKFVSPNDAGTTGSHQAGFYLPKSAWKLFSTHPPTKGSNAEDFVEILWQDELVTKSRVIWYGRATRSEFRLTRFGKGFPFLGSSRVGNLFVLIPDGHLHFSAYVLESDEDIDELLAVLGIEIFEGWGVYADGQASVLPVEECEASALDKFSRSLRTFPTGDAFSDEAIRVMESCHKKLLTGTTDDRLLKGLEIEYRLFKSVEQKLCSGEIAGPFLDVDAFLQTAATIMNRRKSRAGRSLENHVDEAMTREGIPHDIRARDIQGAPDIVVPNVAAYMDPKWPRSRVFVIGVKTTCKDRWRQIVNEGPLVKRKYLLTTQQGISEPQLAEMARSNVTLVVPQGLHSYYPPSARKGILTVDRFFAQMQNALDA